MSYFAHPKSTSTYKNSTHLEGSLLFYMVPGLFVNKIMIINNHI